MAATGPISDVISRKILDWLFAGRDPIAPRDPGTGDFLLPYGRAFHWIAFSLLLLSTAFLALGFASMWGDAKALLLTTSIFGLMWLASLYSVYDVRFVTIGFNNAGIHRRGLMGGKIQLSWEEITQVSFSESCKWLIFRSGRGTFRVSIYRNGLGTLAALAAPALERGPAAGAGRLLQEKTGFEPGQVAAI